MRDVSLDSEVNQQEMFDPVRSWTENRERGLGILQELRFLMFLSLLLGVKHRSVQELLRGPDGSQELLQGPDGSQELLGGLMVWTFSQQPTK